MKNLKGFTVVELLIVVILIAIIAAIAIPSLLASRRAANEASAINSVRTIHSAELTYFAGGGGKSNYASLASLGTLGIIDDAVASGSKSGYTINAEIPATAPFSSYCSSALATAFGTTGNRDFGAGQIGVIWENSTDGQMDCTGGILTTGAAAAVIQ